MRYAIYFTPHTSSPLWTFGSAVLGYDAATGQEATSLPQLAALPVAQWTADPRRYGFHATLKAPFHLRDDVSQDSLLARARAFAAQRNSFEEPPLRLAQLGSFIALTLATPSAAVTSLADDAVAAFDPWRAPLGAQDLARRLQHPLPPRQMAHLERWGYPYVFEDFTFHMTLSGSLDDKPRRQFLNAMEAAYVAIAAPVRFDAITVFRQDAPGLRFTVLERIAFGQ